MSQPTELFAEVKELSLNILLTDDSNNAIDIDTPLL